MKIGDYVVNVCRPGRVYQVSEYNMRNREGEVNTQYVDLDWAGSVPRETLRPATIAEIEQYVTKR